jgi:hypothetical protein
MRSSFGELEGIVRIFDSKEKAEKFIEENSNKDVFQMYIEEQEVY